MTTESEQRRCAEDGRLAYESGRYEAAASLFRAAADGYTALKDLVNAAEQKNNLCVALLKMGRGQEALDAALGTDEVFVNAKDVRRQGIAANNQAAALESLHRYEEALAAYEHAARLLAEAGEGDLRSMVLKAAAGIQLRRGKVADAGIRMIGVLEAREHPSLFERILRFLLRLIQR